MMIIKRCPLCGKEYKGHPAISRKNNRTQICQDCGIREALEPAVQNGVIDQDTADRVMVLAGGKARPISGYERERDRIHATGNRWAIENFHATHD